MRAQTQILRRSEGGLVDRSQPISFRFDDMALTGFQGDTLASALLANGIRLVGRSFKYHRPRGLLSAGPEEPNALVELRTGARREPNTRATEVELYEGLEARSQNRWPSLENDLLSLNQFASPIFVAGFYYKTFKWPAAFWEPVYERLIRRAAGLGSAATEPDPDRYEKAYRHCDLLVVGSGPAGLMAARVAAGAGLRVILAEEGSLMGGRLNAERVEIDEMPGAAWAAEAVAELTALPEVTLMTRTSVVGRYDGQTFGLLERVTDHLGEPAPELPRQRLWHVFAKRAVLASGAIERPLVFADNDRPGVMLAGAVRAYLNRWAVRPGRRALVFANSDEGYRTALDLRAAEVEVAAVVDPRPESAGDLAQEVRAAGIEVRQGHAVVRALGGKRGVEAAVVGKRAGHGVGTPREIACDLIAMSGGWDPLLHLTCHLGAKPVYDEALPGFRPQLNDGGLKPVGAAAGHFGLRDALREGAKAGAKAARVLGFDCRAPMPPRVEEPRETRIQAFWCVPKHGLREGKRFVDFQNDVTVKDIELAAREGFTSVELTKRYTTLGMATDQGKTGNINGLAILAAAQRKAIPEVGTTTYRPPYTPVSFGALTGPDRGRHFAPIRRTALHACHETEGAVFVEAGHWLRPRWYPLPGEGMMDSINREAVNTRNAVGMVDVSPLGKIEIKGPDTAEFLNRLYTNGWKTLAVGRARYGIMLREDGMVFDDGTTSRLGEDHFFMTTTTANAARVLQHMEYYHQVVWPNLDLRFASVTDGWAGIALAGPLARKVLERVVEEAEVSNEALPYMGVVEGRAAGAPARIFRISFSGELGYEINVPAGHGPRLWAALREAGEPFGLQPYGMEALGVMRIEKGHVAGPELNGRTTIHDLGLGKMASTKKEYVGRRLSERPALADPNRPRLVGLRPVNPEQRLRGGAQIVPGRSYANTANAIGYATSAIFSPNLGHYIALAMVSGGLERLGEKVDACYPLKDERVAVEICNPVFIDPEGKRLRA